ncbi:MAG: anthranilate synthase component I [Betaproteobacteria bacterium]|nr:anthranilate synthase component I [Betaproteobacteria bacterium]
MKEADFQALVAQGYNRIPLLAEALADLDTPLSLYLKLTQGGGAGSFLLESVVGGERFGRYSFIGLPARTLIRTLADSEIEGGVRTEVVIDGLVQQTDHGDPLEFVRRWNARYRVALRPGLPRFCGGLAGYFGYDIVRHIEPCLARGRKADPMGMPEILLLQVDELAIVDNVAGRIYLMVYADPEQPQAYANASNRLKSLQDRLRNTPVAPLDPPVPERPVQRDFAREDFLSAVARAREYIAAGDAMQIVLAQCLKKPFEQHPLSLYRALRSINPSPYMYYYDFGDCHVVGASPEILVRQEQISEGPDASQTRVIVRPIAGTRRRGATPVEDDALAQDLLADQKERAEHLMLIDLARNDVGRIARIGSVTVTETMAIEKYSHVMHMVSNVEGVLKPGLDNIDVLRAAFPAGTLSGAPKVRAMELIDELEPVGRGVYGGACGYLSYSGEMDLAIAIRTGIIKEGVLHAQAGAGVVYDSIPESEWQETETKARALIRAAELVEQGLT